MTHDHHHHHHHHHHGGHHHHSQPNHYNRAFIVGLILNTGFVFIEFISGLFANSIALIADAGHNLSDVLGLSLAFGASLLARRNPSGRYTYGWRKSSILAAFLNAVFLLVATGGIVWEAIQRLLNPSEVTSSIIIGVAAIGIVINAGSALMFLSGRHSDMNIKAAFLHLAGDAFLSLGVVLSGIAILFTQWLWLDPAMSLVVSALIIFNTWELLKDSFHLAIDAVPERIDERAVHTYLLERPGVEQVHDLHIWAISTTETALTAHLVVPMGYPGDEFIQEIRHGLQEHFGIDHPTLQIEVGESGCFCSLMQTESESQ